MASNVRPIKPGDVASTKKASFPDAVLEAFNELIAQHFVNGSATVKQEDAIVLIMQKMNMEPEDRHKIFDNGWLNVEEIYRAEGWRVSYDKPGYNESYPATFEFSKRR